MQRDATVEPQIPTMMDKNHKGRVKRWITNKGYGFITEDDTGHDFFVHKSALMNVSGPPNGVVVVDIDTEVVFTVCNKGDKEECSRVRRADNGAFKRHLERKEAQPYARP